MPPLTATITPVTVFPSTASAVQFRWTEFTDRPSYLYTLGNIVDDLFVPLPSANGNVSMTQAQWNAWGEDVDDNAYQVACLCKNLDLSPVV